MFQSFLNYYSSLRRKLYFLPFFTMHDGEKKLLFFIFFLFFLNFRLNNSIFFPQLSYKQLNFKKLLLFVKNFKIFFLSIFFSQGKVLLFVAEKDFLRDKGLWYYEAAKKSGWGGVVEEKEYISSISWTRTVKQYCQLLFH